VRANRKGVAARRGLKEAGSDSRGSMNKNRIEAFVVGRAGAWPRSPYPSRAAGVDSAGVRRRRSNLPREVSGVLRSKGSRLSPSQGGQNASEKSAEGIVVRVGG